MFIFTSIGCKRAETASNEEASVVSSKASLSYSTINVPSLGNEALLLTRFRSLTALRRVVQIEYSPDSTETNNVSRGKARVTLTHRSDSRVVTSILETGISQADFSKARIGSIWNKLGIAFRCPFALSHRSDLKAIESLGRRRPWEFGKGDVAFYDMAEAMVHHIVDVDVIAMPAEDLSEKGYLNTFNHITAQAFMTSIFSEKVADFVADVHERFNMPELITGDFTEAQLADLEKGPVDNYIDIINNEWGQELGKTLRKKYAIDRKTSWSPTLVANYLNDIQRYHSWVFQIGFHPFKHTDDKVILFARKINRVLTDR